MPRIIELRWKCGECDTDGILGRHKNCPSCGSPREKGEMKMDGLGADDYKPDGYNTAATVTDPELLKLAKAGADWFCTHCTSGNIGNGDSCSSCGAPRYAKPEEDHPDFKGAHKHVQGWDAKLEEEMKGGWAEDQPEYEPEPRRASRQPEPEVDEVEDWKSSRKFALVGVSGTALLFSGGGVLLLLLIGFLVWAFQSHEVEGSVSKMTWSQATVVQTWTTYKVRKWEDETSRRAEVPPTNGKGERAGMTFVGGCSEEHHHDEEYQCGTRQEDYECGSNEDYQGTCTRSERYSCGETCRDNGNGFATCTTDYCSRNVDYSCTKSRYVSKTCQRTVPKYCDRPIYETKCDYETQEWRTVKTVPAQGRGLGTRWPQPEPGALDRLRFQADYTILISYQDRGKDRIYEHKPASTKGFLGGKSLLTRPQARTAESAYKAWEPGETVTLRINNLGGIREVQHGDDILAAEEE